MPTEKHAELKGCPFCGGHAQIDQSDFGSAMAYCTNDVECQISPETGFHDTREQAIAAWNTRAALAVGGEEPESRVDERATLLVLANQYLALQKWVQATVPEWTQEVQCCMDDCERTANRIIDYLDGKLKHLNPRRELAATRAGNVKQS